MRITHLGHACLLVEVADRRLLLDPGSFTPGIEDLAGLDAVVVTHQHPDHLDAQRLPGILEANPGAQVLVEAQALASVDGAGGRGQELAVGAEHRIGDVRLRGVGGRHAVIHADLPRIANVGVLVDDGAGGPVLFHPGDAYEEVPEGVDVLALPLHAPWCAVEETVDFVRAVGPRAAFPIHDGLLNAAGRGMYLSRVSELAPDGTEVRDLAGAGAVDLG